MAVTRINNNQITDASAGNIYLGINANTKLQNYSITSAKIANDLTYGSNLTVTGNLTVQGNTTAIDTTITTIEDPVIVLASTQTGSPAVDIGFIGQRGTSENIAFVWNEANAEFVTAFTSTAETSTTVSITGYADLHTANATIGGNAVITGTTSLTGNILGDANITGTLTGGNISTAGTVSATGDVTGGNILTGGNVSATGNVYAASFIGNVSGNVAVPGANTDVIFNDNGIANATSGFTFDKVSNAVTVTGNITGGNILTSGSGGEISGSGNITGGNIATGGIVTATGTITGGNIATGGTVSATGDITGANVSVTGNIIPTANVTYTLGSNNYRWKTLYVAGNTIHLGNLQVKNIDSNIFASYQDDGVTLGSILTADLSATGNITGGNIRTGGLVSATGTVTGGNLETAGTANVTGTITGGNIATGGTASATGNITGGNVLTGGLVSATGTVTGGNLETSGTVSATSTITGGNVDTGGTVSATGNITGGNVLTGGIVSATGNVNGANVETAQVYGATTLTLAAGTGNINLETTGNIVLANTIINGLAQPLQNQDAATKLYVDTIATTGITIHPAVYATTNTTLETATGGTITYAQPNGVANGVGATLTTTGSFNLIDTANVQTLNTRILVKDQANGVQNGVYIWSNATVLVRATDADEYGADSAESFSLNDYFFTTNGNVNAGAAFVVDAPTGTITFGTSNIQFAQFSSSQVYSANTAAGISLVGTVFSAKVDNNTTAFDGSGNISVKASANLTTPNIGAATGTSLSTTGTITGGNLETSGTISATSTITGGNLATGGTISATSTITGGNVDTSGTISATGSITGGNLYTGGDSSATGTLTGGNIVTGGTITSTGTVTGGNIATGGTVSATGTVTGGNLETGGTVSATGTATLGNVSSGGQISAVGDVIGGNLSTGGSVSATGDINGGNVGTGGFVTATGNVTGGNILTSGYMSAIGNVYAANFIGNVSGNISAPGANTQVEFNDNGTTNATSGFTFDKISNTVTVGANVDAVSFNGNVYSTTVSATGTITGGNVDTGGTVSATGNIIGGNVVTSGIVSATTSVTGGNIVISGDDITDTNGRVNFNTAGADVDFAVNGDTVANVFYIDAGTGTASFGSAAQTVNAIVAFNTTNSILAPVGNTGQRPAVGVTGMVRFNTTNNNLELFDNSQWTAVGVPEFTVITDQQFSGTGSQTVFTLSEEGTTAGTIVSINGVQQIPVTAYAVSGTTLTFTEAPEVGDLIDVRTLTTTTSVTSISNNSGNAEVSVSDTAALVNVTGDLSVAGTIIGGNINSAAISNGTSNVAVISSGGNVTTTIAGTTVMTVSTGLVGVTGNISATGDVIAQNVNSLSDATLKANVAPIDNAGTVVDGLNGVGYDWADGSGHAYGMIAQQVEEVIPEAVKTDANGIKSVNYSMVIPFLVETVKQLRQDIAEIKAQLKK